MDPVVPQQLLNRYDAALPYIRGVQLKDLLDAPRFDCPAFTFSPRRMLILQQQQPAAAGT
jgi:hypothetical protein